MSFWNPWHGCKKCSEGCKYCYIYKGDYKRGIDTSNIVKTKDFDKPIIKNKNGTYKMKSGLCYMCFSSDFLLEEADSYRNECLDMIKQRPDVTFLFLTKRIDRFSKVIQKNFNTDNLVVCCTVENQKNVDYRLSIFNKLPIKHKCLTIQPLLEDIDISKYLDGIELVVVGGESDYNARPLDYNWVLNIRKQCIEKNVSFEFRQCGTHFIKDNQMIYLKTNELSRTARSFNINYRRKDD